MSPRNKSTLFQQDPSWKCGPYTAVKVGLFRHFFDYILMRAFHLSASVLIRGLSMKTAQPCLGNMTLDIQHTVTPVEGVSQLWNGVATDNDILSYIADTLLISFQDKKSLMELKTKYSDQPNKCWEFFTKNIMHPLLKKLKRRCVSKPQHLT